MGDTEAIKAAQNVSKSICTNQERVQDFFRNLYPSPHIALVAAIAFIVQALIDQEEDEITLEQDFLYYQRLLLGMFKDRNKIFAGLENNNGSSD
jgi:hypothetical protein